MTRTKQMRPDTSFFPTRLMKRLDFIKAYPLTLVEAPSGFGKTTALHHFFDTQVSKSAKVIWYTFSEEPLNTSWKAFCKLIEQFDPESAKKLKVAGPPDEDTLLEIESILKNLSCQEETYLVLDDLASWKLPNVGIFLTALSKHTGKSLHIVAATQVLSSQQQLTMTENSCFSILRESVLTFQAEDIDAYYRKAGISLTPIQLEEVHQITEGWVMALYLQLLTFIENGHFEGDILTIDMEELIQLTLTIPPDKKEKDIIQK